MPDLEKTLAARTARYGDFTDRADVAQQLQDVIRFDGTAPRVGWAKLSAVQRQALTVIADKIARILTGDPDYTDNWHDIQGYAKLAEDRCIDKTLPQLDLDDQGRAEAALEQAFSGPGFANDGSGAGTPLINPEAAYRPLPRHTEDGSACYGGADCREPHR